MIYFQMNREEMITFIENSRVPNSDIVFDSKGNKESGSFLTSTAAELASNIYRGTHSFKDVKNNVTEVWFFGKSITLGL